VENIVEERPKVVLLQGFLLNLSNCRHLVFHVFGLILMAYIIKTLQVSNHLHAQVAALLHYFTLDSH